MSLRHDSGRLSLESVLSGTALGLALLYLINDMGAAARPAGAGQPAASPGPFGGGDRATAGAGSRARHGGAEGTALEIQGPTRARLPASSAGVRGDRLVPSGGLMSGALLQAPVELADAGNQGQPFAPGPGNGPATPAGSIGTVPQPGGAETAIPIESHGHLNHADPISLRAAPPPLGGGTALPSRTWADLGGADLSGADPLVYAEPTASPQLAVRPILDPDPVLPGLRVVLRSSEGMVSRAVEGAASTDYRRTLGAITDVAIDLREQETPQVLVSSDSQLHLLALSLLGDATLTLASDNTVLDRATLLLGSEVNTISIALYTTIDAALIAGMAGRSQIQQSLIALRDSLLQDSGPGGSLAISSLSRFLLKAPGGGLNHQLGIDLLAEAMNNSSILLGDGNDRVTLTSGFRDLAGSGPGLLIDIPSAAGSPNGQSVQLRARAIGLENSKLDTGGGNDQVSIQTWLDSAAAGLATASTELGRIALLHSSVRLGAGNDQLDLEGAVLDSRLDLGSGDNRLSIDGAVQQSAVLLGPDSRNQITLWGDTNNSLSLALAPGDRASVTLLAGAGDDRLEAPLERLAGSIDGGGGRNALEASGDSPLEASEAAPQGAAGDPLRVSLEAPGAGTVSSLEFRRIDRLRVAAKEVRVSVAATAELSGALEAAGPNPAEGHATIDYSAWHAPVLVNLGLGTASGILGGIRGFQEVIGGSGDDQLTAGATTSRLDGGPGQDTIELNLATNRPGSEIFGGHGRDTFVLSGLEAIQAGSTAGERALPPLTALADLSLETTASGGIGLTDTLQWRQQGIHTAPGGAAKTITLTSSGLEGLGRAELLPIAPLAQLLAGMASIPLAGQQLAIAAGTDHSSLLLLRSDRSYSTIADLPSLHLASGNQANPSSATSPTGPAA